jgi:hypothetical protein
MSHIPSSLSLWIVILAVIIAVITTASLRPDIRYTLPHGYLELVSKLSEYSTPCQQRWLAKTRIICFYFLYGHSVYAAMLPHIRVGSQDWTSEHFPASFLSAAGQCTHSCSNLSSHLSTHLRTSKSLRRPFWLCIHPYRHLFFSSHFVLSSFSIIYVSIFLIFISFSYLFPLFPIFFNLCSFCSQLKPLATV